MNVTTCLECHRDIDVTNFINALYRHNITIGVQVAIAIITKKPIPQGQGIALGFQAAQNAINDPMLPFVNDKTICKLCLQKYAICWNCGRYVREIDYIKTLQHYDKILSNITAEKTSSNHTIREANYQLTVRNTKTVNKANTNIAYIENLEQIRPGCHINYHCDNCLQ